MDIGNKQQARESVLETLGLARLVDTSTMDIAQPHNALVERQAEPARFVIDGLTIDAPAGIYHPTLDSSTEFFLRNIRGMKSSAIRSVLEIGAGCGAISLYIAANWDVTLKASDISPLAVEAIKHNAAQNGLEVDVVQSDMFERIPREKFDFIVFNAPLIDKMPENAIEQYSLCDPNGAITRAFLRGAEQRLTENGLAIVSICRNSAYEVLNSVDLNYSIVGFELSVGGFWRAIVGARLPEA
ncbi:MAG TPA: class I SAM-dependent methyltransferase [Roseiarcus sp.]